MVDAFGDPESLFGQGEPLLERPTFGVTVAQVGPEAAVVPPAVSGLLTG